MDIKDYKYRIELHAHTSPASGCSSVKPERMAQVHKEMGYDAVVITNHCSAESEGWIETYLDNYNRTKAEGDKLGVTVILGMEYNAGDQDYLVYGIDEDFVKKSMTRKATPYADFYKEMKNEHNVFLCAHPFRKPWRDLGDEYLDGIEVFNMHPGHNSRVSIAARYAKLHNMPIITCGSDFHDEPNNGMICMRTKTLPKDSYELADILKSRDYIFEMSGNIIIPYGFKAGK